MMLLLSLVVGELQDKASQLDMFSEFTLTHVELLAKCCISSIRCPGYYLFQCSIDGAIIRGVLEGGYYNISRIVARRRRGSSHCFGHSRTLLFCLYRVSEIE